MTKSEATKIMKTSIARLNKVQKKRLRRHAKLTTPILCGAEVARERFVFSGMA